MEMANPNRFDVIVAGVGTMGAAACYHLAKRGLSVLGLEQFDIPHGRGSHHGHSRMIRQSYFEHPDYVPLLKRAYELWEELERESGLDVIEITGGLYLGSPGATILAGSRLAAETHGLPHDRLDRAGLAERFPAFQIPDHFEGFYEERAGYVVPERAMEAHVKLALAEGAVLKAREGVNDWEADGKGIRVRAGTCEYLADRLLLTAGAWTGRCLGSLEIELVATRQLLAWFQPREPKLFERGSFPCWFIESDSPYGHYGFPLQAEQPGLKIALHRPGEPIDPDQLPAVQSAPDPSEIDALRATLATFLPGGAGPLLETRSCLYTNSVDGHFIVDQHPEVPAVTLACGFSGHGFKFATVMGEILADLAEAGKTDHPIDFLRLRRFA